MPFDERSFDNPFLSTKPQNSDPNKILTADVKSRIKQFVHSHVGVLQDRLSDGSISSRDTSVYTGLSGIALTLLKVEESRILSQERGRELLILAYKLTKGNHSRNSSAFTLLCGSSGALAMEAIIRQKIGKDSQSLLKQVIDLNGVVSQSDSRAYNEFLYGRVGYLGAFTLLEKYFPSLKDELLAERVCDAIIHSGLKASKKHRATVPLFYEWHEKEYVGGAHGYAGIYYYLLKHKHCPSVQKILEKELRDSLQWFLKLQFKSGNYPSSIGSHNDKLVHWCHGAPGAVYTLIAAYEVYGDEKFKEAALACGECVWKRGFLQKGYGICHGTAGNAYTFLALYRLTSDVMHLHRAVCFAELCLSFDKPHRTADRPFSLFEGLAGTIYFLTDILDVEKATFPCYEI